MTEREETRQGLTGGSQKSLAVGGGLTPTVTQPSGWSASRLPPVRDELSPAARPVVAAPGWPVRIPGRPGWWRQSIDDQQVDVPPRGIHGE